MYVDYKMWYNKETGVVTLDEEMNLDIPNGKKFEFKNNQFTPIEDDWDEKRMDIIGQNGNNGSQSKFDDITAEGGGGGGKYITAANTNSGNGSGGGGGGYTGTTTAGGAAGTYGYAGGGKSDVGQSCKRNELYINSWSQNFRINTFSFNTPHNGSRCSDWCGGAGSYRLSKTVAPYMSKSQTCFSGYSPGTIASVNTTNCTIYFREK